MKLLSGKLEVVLFIIGSVIFGYGCPVVNIANAQCAWVLWESRSDDGYLHWQVNDAFPSYEKCKQGQRIECERWRSYC